ncbi:MAG: hypothetical protein JST54_02915 [Deltaproteobacteria bacterium]|nr:hypothetical protein [Deltaproteobacteria bacterium]
MPATLARLLVEGGVINRTLADECLRRHLQVGGALDTVLLEAGACTEPIALAYLAQASELQPGFSRDFALVDPKITQIFPFKLADRHGMMPLELGKRHLSVAASYPVEKLLLEELSFMLGRDLRPRIAIEARVRDAISHLYNRPLAPRFATLLKQLGMPPTAVPDLAEARAKPAPVRQSDAVLGKAAKVGEIASWPPPGVTPAPPTSRAPLASKARPVPPPSKARPATPPPPPPPARARAITPPAPPPPLPKRPTSAEGPILQAEATLEEDASALLGEELAPPPPPAPIPTPPPAAPAPPPPVPPIPVIEMEIAPPQPAEVEANRVSESPLLDAGLDLPAPTGEEDVRVDDDIAGPPLPPVAAAPEPPREEEPIPLLVKRSPGVAAPLAAAPPAFPPAPAPARPKSYSALDTREMLAAWRPSGELGRLEDALAYALDGVPSASPAPEPWSPRPDPRPDPAPEPQPAPAEAAEPDIEVEVETPEPQPAPEPVLPPQPIPPQSPTDPYPWPRVGWTLSEARAHLAAAPARDQIIEVALRFALKSFDFAAALAIRSGTAFGWAGLTPDGQWHEEVHRVMLPLDSPSVLRTVLRARGRYLGPLPEDQLTDQLLRDMGRERPQVALLYPVFVRERPAAIFYADRGRKHVAAPRVAEFLLFAQELATAFERSIILGKRRPVRAVAESALLPEPEPTEAEAAEEQAPQEEALFPIAEPTPEVIDAGRPLEAVLADLVGSDRPARLRAMAELEAVPEQAAAALAAQFPGPTALRRGLVLDLPDPEELGPVLGALARLKMAALPYVDQLLREGDPDQRFFAVLLAGSLHHPALFPGLLRTLFDPVSEVAAAARAAASKLRLVPTFEETVERNLRAELGSDDIDRVVQAALAIGRTRDVQAVPLLIPLTGHADDRVAAEASDALTQITKQTHGDSPRRWSGWWEQNQNRPRVAWLVEGLAHKDLQVRLSSIEELSEITHDSFGYAADGGRRERERALEKWDQWLHQQFAS